MKSNVILKKILLLLLVNLIFLPNSNAQMKIDAKGRVFMGKCPTTYTGDRDGVLTAQLLGTNGQYFANSKLAFGDFGTQVNYGWNVFIGEYTNNDTDQLWLHGKNGLYYTFQNGLSNYIVAYYDISKGNRFNFNCDVYASGIKLTSDERMKEYIQPMSEALESLRKLNGVTYFLKTPLMNSSQDNISRTQVINNTDLTEKELRDKDFFEKWDQELQNKRDLRFGLIAQDLRKVFPQLVSEDKEGMLSVDYIGLIPIIIEAMKEQQSLIETQDRKIQELEDLIYKNPTFLNSTSNSENKAILYQNTPNPFKVKTEIRYELPIKYNFAVIFIFDMQGKLIKQIDADNSGSIEILGNNLSAGIYLYSLVIDGKEIDTKRMILTE